MSWLTLLLATVGVLIAVIAVASILFGALTRASVGLAAAAVAVVLSVTFEAPGIHAALSFLNAQRLAVRGLPPEKARDKCLVDSGNPGQAQFLEFVRQVVPGQTRDAWVGGFPVDPACVSFVLMPRLLEADARNATWAIFTGGVPANWSALIVPGSVRTFKPGQLVARLRR